MRPAALALAVFLAWSLCRSAPARADTTVASLGVRSVDGESDLERRLSAALRTSASTIAGWSVGKREASLDQMMLAIGCEEPDAPCLSEVAKTLAVQLLVFGSVTSVGGNYDLVVSQFDTTGKQIHTAASRGVKASMLRGTSGREAVLALLGQLNQTEAAPEAPVNGQLRIHGDVPNAEIAIDGQSAGALDERGYLTLELTPGKHVVRAAGQAFAPAEEKPVLVEAGATAQVELAIAPPAVAEAPPRVSMPEASSAPEQRPSHTLRRVFGWASLGIGTAFAIATIYSWVRIERINDDGDFLTYRSAWPRAGGEMGVGNVCPRASRGELTLKDDSKRDLERRANDLCNEADRLQALQYVFLGGALVGAGVGTYLLVSARRMERREAATSISFAPRFGFQSASLEARLRF